MSTEIPTSNVLPDTQPRPTQKAFEPASQKQLWSGMGTGLVCLAGFAIGGLSWLDPQMALATAASAGQQGEYELFFLLLMFIFPLFLIIAGYFFWQTWRWWGDTRAFERSKQKTTGLITHLWLDPPKGQGKKYYAGYRFGGEHTAYQQVHSRVFNRLTVGESVKVEYVPGNPRLSYLNLKK
ncbi:MAG: hypothetical protein HS126_38330 [Anaerolineales bacterium]|nr:hypothetical protein [Anaerolineales bacterium]